MLLVLTFSVYGRMQMTARGSSTRRTWSLGTRDIRFSCRVIMIGEHHLYWLLSTQTAAPSPTPRPLTIYYIDNKYVMSCIRRVVKLWVSHQQVWLIFVSS
jgi:hypothetical protein